MGGSLIPTFKYNLEAMYFHVDFLTVADHGGRRRKMSFGQTKKPTLVHFEKHSYSVNPL